MRKASILEKWGRTYLQPRSFGPCKKFLGRKSLGPKIAIVGKKLFSRIILDASNRKKIGFPGKSPFHYSPKPFNTFDTS
jgi:hypothetical protein